MVIQQELLSRRVPNFSYPSIVALQEGISAKDAYRYDKHDLYPRDGFSSLARLERHLAQLVGVDDDGYILLTTTGMSAIVTAIETANPTKGDVIVHGFQSYSKSREYIEEDLQPRGIKPVGVRISNLDAVASAINVHRPKVVFFETVSNGTEAEILDIEGFLRLPILKEVNPRIVLDNTLPTDSNLPLAHLIKQTDLKIIGVESGTKSYALNQDLAGIIYTYDRDLFKKLQRKRRRGDSPGQSLVKTLEGVIPPTKEQFDRENRTIASNTAALALACWGATDSRKIMIVHHGLPDHPQSSLANALYPSGASPVFFILSQPQWQGSENDVSIETIAKALETSLLANGLLPNKDFYFAQSFGFNKIGISVVPDSYIRIAGGLETSEQLEKMKRALADGLYGL